ncbi:NACHT domain-containing protein [Nonomuraea sp. MCN248]|uniref:NACHT domain-containing protein n=1 Tax=Nonomuraea corallina TaxID=2989783 RepID=A0ABT4SEH7_9ACTN|nr:NACHT domain-containing protein [Nonomuraea corallina]MDA0635601.1 NACHT domain-containing protein [Nonomuraea corallina]
MAGDRPRPPDPAEATDAADFVRALVRLRQWAGEPSLSRLRALGGQTATPDGTKVDALPRSTTSHVLRQADRLPRWDFVRAFVTACFHYCDHPPELVPGELERWRAARAALAERAAPDPPAPAGSQVAGDQPVGGQAAGEAAVASPPDPAAALLARRVLREEDRSRKGLLGGYTLAPVSFGPYGAGRAEHDLHEIGRFFAGLRPRRLLVVGESGAGKTVLAIELVLRLLEPVLSAGEAPGRDQPVPVRLNAARWTLGRPFEPWLAEQLTREFGLTAGDAQRLVRDRRVLPVVDGLDELDPEPPTGPPRRAIGLLTELNRYSDHTGRRPGAVVVTCRADRHAELCEAAAGLDDAAVIRLHNLDAGQIAAYLRARWPDGHPRAACRDVVHAALSGPAGRAVHAALGTPWRLLLLVTAVESGGDPAELLHVDPPDGDPAASHGAGRAGGDPAASHGVGPSAPGSGPVGSFDVGRSGDGSAEVFGDGRSEGGPAGGFGAEGGDGAGAAVIAGRLLEAYVPAATDLAPRSSAACSHGTPYEPAQVRAWLACLAACLREQARGGTDRPPGLTAIDLVPHLLWPIGGRRRVRALHGLCGVLFAVVAMLTFRTGSAAGDPEEPLALVLVAGWVALATTLSLARWPAAAGGRTRVPRRRRFAGGLLGASAGAVVGVLGGLAGLALTGGRVFGPGFAVAAGGAGGLVLGAVIGLTAAGRHGAERMTVAEAIRAEPLSLLGFGLCGALTALPPLRLAGAGPLPLAVGFAGAFALAFALGIAFTIATGGWSKDAELAHPREALRRNAVIGLAFGLVGAVAAFLVFVLHHGVLRSLLCALVGGVTFGLAFGATAWARTMIGLGVAAARGLLPLRLWAFLDWACEARLLRVSGATYQFRHRELQDHLAPPDGSGGS